MVVASLMLFLFSTSSFWVCVCVLQYLCSVSTSVN
jgi:hypothetical protein